MLGKGSHSKEQHLWGLTQFDLKDNRNLLNYINHDKLKAFKKLIDTHCARPSQMVPDENI